jgi:hypothetical protein
LRPAKIAERIAGIRLVQRVDKQVDGNCDNYQEEQYALTSLLDILAPVLLALGLYLLWREHPASDLDCAGHGEVQDKDKEEPSDIKEYTC